MSIQANDSQPIDFMLYFGEENSNESVFRFLKNFERKEYRPSDLLKKDTVHTCTVG